MFSHPRLALAVARGSGPAVAQLGAVARQAGLPVSLHGTGGAWLVAGRGADADRFAAAVRTPLDRKVCNTLNVCCIVKDRAEELVPRFLAAADAAGERRAAPPSCTWPWAARGYVPGAWFARMVERAAASRARRASRRPNCCRSAVLGTEWEWEESPEVTLVVVDGLDAAMALFNEHSPRLVASLALGGPSGTGALLGRIDAPFVGDGFTRWVDGQFAFDRPELGLSNWQHGRLFARGGVLSGDSVFTVRTRAFQTDPDLHR